MIKNYEECIKLICPELKNCSNVIYKYPKNEDNCIYKDDEWKFGECETCELNCETKIQLIADCNGDQAYELKSKSDYQKLDEFRLKGPLHNTFSLMMFGCNNCNKFKNNKECIHSSSNVVCKDYKYNKRIPQKEKGKK